MIKKQYIISIFSLLCVCAMMSCYARTKELPVCNSNVGINAEGLNYYSAGMPYYDLAKMAMGWIRPWHSSWEKNPLDLDENGYLKVVDEGGTQTIIHDDEWGRSLKDSKYVLLYDGEGDIEFNLSKPRIISKKPGRIEVELTKGRLGMSQKSTKKDNPLRNIRFVPASKENSYQSTIVRDEYINLWKGISVIRYLNQQTTNNSKEVNWQDRKKLNSFGTVDSTSLEDIIQTANETNTNPWLLAPHLANDDYFKNMAIYVKDHLKPNLKVYLEYTNEAWNGSFQQAKYLAEIAKKNNTSQHFEYGKRSLELFKIWEEVFGGANRLVRIISTQLVNPQVTEQIFTVPELASHTDGLAVGYYFGYELGTAGMVDKTLTMSEDEVLHYLESESIPKTKAFAEQQQKLAKKYNLELMAYEAGQHLVGAGWTQKLGLLTDNKKLAEKFINVNRNVKMKELYLAFYKNWQEIGGGLLVWFQATGKASRWGSWGLLENMGDIAKKSPKYQAFQLIMSKTACASNK